MTKQLSLAQIRKGSVNETEIEGQNIVVFFQSSPFKELDHEIEFPPCKDTGTPIDL